ncbi:hypothetical protein ANO11243_012140 [Dothideomycetidae sp. 11243]|nr:hypothetical protein ANO11243_012140 [fungal sp. No.11243]
MRAWQYTSISGGLDKSLHLNLSAQPPPAPPVGSGNVLVEVVSASINPGEYKVAELPYIGGWVIKKPATPGMDFSGRVAVAAAGFEKGERVFGRVSATARHGSLGQCVIASSASMTHLPDAVSFNDGACLGTAALTAYQTLVPFLPGGKGQGRTVFVNGASGGVGTFTVQIAKALGCHVVAACSGANAQMVMDLGADEVIDYRTKDLCAELRKKGPTFDLVVDNVGAPFSLHRACDSCVKQGGMMVQIGGMVSVPAVLAFMDSALRPAFLGGPKTPWKFAVTQTDKTEDLRQLADLAASGRIRSVIDTVFPFSEAPRAYEKLKTGRARGNMVVSTDDSRSILKRCTTEFRICWSLVTTPLCVLLKALRFLRTSKTKVLNQFRG